MAKVTNTMLKAKKQISEYTSQKMYESMQRGFQMYKIIRNDTGEVVASDITMKQFIRTFHPLNAYRLEPL